MATHTRLVLDELARMPAYRELEPTAQEATYLACLFHDSGKPATTKIEPDGRITSRGHSRSGTLLARRILYNLKVPFTLRERVCPLVLHHQLPFFLIDSVDFERKAISASMTARCDLLSIVAEADARGRTCADKTRILDRVALFREACDEIGCLNAPFSFASDQSRFEYFRTPGRSPRFCAHDSTELEVTVLSGLPGSGKDQWIAANVPALERISLDEIRETLDIEPTLPQGKVAAAARERARELLRRKAPFVFNATNLSRMLRAQWIGLFADYGARVRIVYVEAAEARLRAQNRNRARPVPAPVINRLFDRWEIPDLTEAHSVALEIEGKREFLLP